MNKNDKNEKLTSEICSQKWHEELAGLPKSEKLYIDGLFLSKAYNVSARKCQRNYVSQH